MPNLKFAFLAAAAAIAVTGATLAATSAFAADARPHLVVQGQGPAAARIAYADLNLASPAGIARLNARVRGAAERLCVGAGVETLGTRLDGLACRDKTIAAAAPQVQRAIGRYAAAVAHAAAVAVVN
jgi:UrcA family protein